MSQIAMVGLLRLRPYVSAVSDLVEGDMELHHSGTELCQMSHVLHLTHSLPVQHHYAQLLHWGAPYMVRHERESDITSRMAGEGESP